MTDEEFRAQQYLDESGWIFIADPDDEDMPNGTEDCHQYINQNDVWAWACSDAEPIPDSLLLEVASLVRRYGHCGIYYWVSKRRGWCRSEFKDINRFIDFVRHEEELRERIPQSSKRAYEVMEYTLGVE